MIGHLKGVVLSIKHGYAVVSTGGVGYKVFVTREALLLCKPEGEVAFWTHLAVRENALDLYGFRAEEELKFFELLLSVSGIGPKSALAILDLAPVETLRSAIAGGNASYLTKVSGVGRKTAEKIVLELREKVGAAAEGTMQAMSSDEEVLEAMRSLGYTQTEARDALKKVPEKIEGASERLREALKMLGSR